jgi:hypothetical protein
MKVNIVTNRKFLFLFFLYPSYLYHDFHFFLAVFPFFTLIFWPSKCEKKTVPPLRKKNLSRGQVKKHKRTQKNQARKAKKKFKNERITNSGLRSYCHCCLHCRLILPAVAPTYAAPPVPSSCPGLPLASSTYERLNYGLVLHGLNGLYRACYP